jgi:hypothetical protein
LVSSVRPTGHLVDDNLVPLPHAVLADTSVWLALPAEEGADQIWEGLAAEWTTQHSVRLRAVPLFAYDLNYGDEVVALASAEGPLVATARVKDSGNHTFRIWFADPTGATLPEVITEFGRLGCLIEGYSERPLGLSCGSVQVGIVDGALRKAERAGRFVYERGRQ